MMTLRQLAVRQLAVAAGLVVLSLSSWAAGVAGAPIGNPDDTPGQVTLSIQTNKLTSLVDERFLSLSVDPEQLLRHSQPGPGALRLLSMATALSPAYLRVAGPNTEFMGFEGSPARVGGTLTVNDRQFSQLQTLCRNAGLRAIIGLSARRRPGGGAHWDSRDAMRILAAVDASSLAPAGWQLGYDWTTLRKAGVSPSQAAADVKTLKSLIEEFPTLAKEAQMLLGPDADPTASDAEAESEFTKGANPGAAIIRPFTTDDPTGSKLDKDFINKVLGRNHRRPLWIAESGEQCTAPFSSGLLWAQRLSTATRLGAQVILRELDLDASRNNATSDLWVSLLHKTLTSRGVLEIRGAGPEAGDLSTSAYCTPSSKDHVSSKTQPISPAIRYNLGAVTVMAANPNNRPLRLSLKMVNGIGSPVGASEDAGAVVHEYILTAPGDDLNSTQTLLNGNPLEMAPGGGIPKLSPRQLQLDSSLQVSLPPRSIAFWVVPGAKARACQTSPASSDVAPAASRLRPFSARDMEIGVHLDDDMPLPPDPEPSEAPTQVESTESNDSKETTAKDTRRGRHRLSDRFSGPSRLSLSRMTTPPRRPSLDFNFGRSSRDQEIKTLDDFIREELRTRPRSRSLEPLKLPSLPTPSLRSFDLPNMPTFSRSLELPGLPSIPATSLSIPNMNPLEVPNLLSIPSVSLPTPNLGSLELPAIPTLGQLDTSSLLDPLNMNADLLKLNSDIQHGLVQQATTPLRSLVKMTDGLLDRIEGSPNANRAKRSPFGSDDDPFEEYRSIGFDLDDRLRYRRKSAQSLKAEDLPRKPNNMPFEADATHPIPRGEVLNRRKRDVPRCRRFAPEDMGLRLKRKPAIPDFLSLPRLTKTPLLTPAAKRAQLLISQNEDGVANARGPAYRETFPQGDVFAESEGSPDGRDPDVDYVSDDDYPPQIPPVSKHRGSESDALYLAPAAFYETPMNHRRAPPRPATKVGEIGELEYLPGKTFLTADDTAADSFKVVPAAPLSKEQQAEIQSKLRKQLEDHYAEVQRAALAKKAEAQSGEDVSEERNIDKDSLQALAERYRKEHKLNLSEGLTGSSNGLQKQPEWKETGKTEGQKIRTRRDLGEKLSAMHHVGKISPKHDESAKVDSKSGSLLKREASTDPPHKTAEELKERRMEKVKNFRERLVRSSRDHPHLPHIGHDQTCSSRPKRDTPSKRITSVEKALGEIQKQIEKNGIDFLPWDSTGPDKDYSKIPEPKEEDLTPSARNRGSFYGNRHRPYSSHGPVAYPSGEMRPSYFGSGSPHAHGFSRGYRPPHGYNWHSAQSEESGESTEEEHTGFYPNRHRLPRPRSRSRSDPRLDLPDDVNIEDYPTKEGTLRSAEPAPQRFPNVVSVPWEISRPTNVRFKRYSDNSLVQLKPETGSSDDIASSIRRLHKLLNEDTGSSEEKSAEVNHGGRLIDSSETVDGLENLIQSLLNMTRHLNDTVNEAKNDEMISWTEFGLEDAKPADPQLDSEEMKYRDAAVAWIQAAKNGDITKSSTEKGNIDRPLLGGNDERAAKELARQQKLTEQENVVTAMMQRASVLLSDLRAILNKKEVPTTGS